jgi:hypothetical protein
MVPATALPLFALPLLLLRLLSGPTTTGVSAAGRSHFDQYTTCATCVAAGYGWSSAKGRCGGFANRQCSASDAARQEEEEGSRPPAWAAVESVDVWYEDTVHILVTFCGSGYVTSHKMGPYLRSLLFHRSCKIHFHVMADRQAWDATQELFRSEVVRRFTHVTVDFVPRAENDRWLAKANQLQQQLAFPTSLPGCSFVRIWADGILPDVVSMAPWQHLVRSASLSCRSLSN